MKQNLTVTNFSKISFKFLNFCRAQYLKFHLNDAIYAAFSKDGVVGRGSFWYFLRMLWFLADILDFSKILSFSKIAGNFDYVLNDSVMCVDDVSVMFFYKQV